MKEQQPKTMQLTNSFHNTSINIQYRDWMVPNDQTITWSYIEYRAYNKFSYNHKNVAQLRNRIKKKLCGIKDCKCGVVR